MKLKKNLMHGQSREIPGEGYGFKIRSQSIRKLFSLTGCKSFDTHIKKTDLDKKNTKKSTILLLNIIHLPCRTPFASPGKWLGRVLRCVCCDQGDGLAVLSSMVGLRWDPALDCSRIAHCVEIIYFHDTYNK
jgi:hypothetical protein